MPCELRVDDSGELLANSIGDSMVCHEEETKQPMSPSTPKVATREAQRGCGPVDEFCTCVGFLTCQDPENYEIDDDTILDSNHSKQRSPALPDPPIDPPESHTILIQRTRYNDTMEESTSLIFDDTSNINNSPSRQRQYNDSEEDRNSTATPTTASTIRRTKPEEYEPLLLIVDDDDDDDAEPQDQNRKSYDKELSPTSMRAVRDTSSTSSLQYHRRSPMFLSYASPSPSQQVSRGRGRKDTHDFIYDTTHHKNRHEMVQSLLQNELSKRTGRTNRNTNTTKNTTRTSNNKNNRMDGYSMEYNPHTSNKGASNNQYDNNHRSMKETIRSYSTSMHHRFDKNNDNDDNVDQYRYPTTGTNGDHKYHHHQQHQQQQLYDDEMSSFGSSELLNHYHSIRHQTRTTKTSMTNDTDTVRAVAPDKTIIEGYDDDDDEQRDDGVFLQIPVDPTNQVIVFPRSLR